MTKRSPKLDHKGTFLVWSGYALLAGISAVLPIIILTFFHEITPVLSSIAASVVWAAEYAAFRSYVK